ncbi:MULTISPECIES: TonB-dependent receptor [Bacteroides]|jgi:TonB-linked SusC/RagA family outer membrane protein|uniref:SusC/RagA family TonB-linked outer membrane protein n=1 Tax=Bacteroides TaxID=816 RepID=UPI000E52965D|nr:MULTISPECIES: TonB-dependent receptor [Bacteroides]RHL04290.1 TonB-dependent receptor [Bacteroides sp. AF39-11AC]
MLNVQLKRKRTFAQSMLFVVFLLSSTLAFAQNKVTGTVTDKAGEPLIGVNVLESGTSNGCITDIDGKYSLNVEKGKTLIFSFIGYSKQEVKVTQNVMNVTMNEDTELLDEVVVIGYGSISRKDVTSSISTVKSKDLNVGAYTDPGQLLQGKVPGLVIVQNSDPNGGVNSLTLRGASTLNGSTSPLYVVDGIPGVNLNLISPNDIESIDVLRDASATAIYGSKAANGVIMVTTKRGSDGPARVTYSGYVSWENISNDHEMMSADELRAYAKANNLTIPNDKGANTNWADEVQRTGFAHNHNLSITGGNKSTTYNASINYIERDGIIKGVGNNLFTARTYVETKTLKDRLTLSAGLNGNIRNEWGVPRGGQGASVYNAMYYYSPLVPSQNEDGSWYKDMGISQNYNPLALIYEDESRATYKRIQATGKASLKIIDDLFLSANFSYENQNYSYRDYYSHESQTNNRGGETSRNTTEDIKKLMEIYGNYDKTFNDAHKLGLMVGYSWEEQNNGEGFGARGYNFYDDSLWWNNIGMANSWDEDPVWANTLSTIRMISFYGRANYSYKSKYILQAAIRRDGSSTFGSNHRWATFPSGAIAWRLSEEDFIKDLGIFDDLKLRAGWGQSGNAMGFDIYTSRFYYAGGARFVYTDPETGKETSYKSLNAARNVNPDLKWETTTMLNLGIDFSFLGGRINGTIEYYNKTTKDMIWSYPISTSYYPYGWMVANVGKMNNRGIELSLNATPIQGRNFTWNTSLNLSHNRNKIVSLSNQEYNAGVLNRYNPELPGASTATIQRIIEGEPIGTFYMWEWAGYDQNGVSQFYVHDKETGERTGETTNTPEEKDRTIVGNAQPWLTMGWNNNLTYKNWDFNAFFTGVFGQKIFNEPRAFFSNIANVTEGKNVMKSIVSEQKATDSFSSLPSDRYLENGSYFRLSTLTVGYTFRNFNGWLRDVRLYASCNNVFTLTGYKGRDPEINLGGETPGCDTRSDHYPRTRQFLVGATINF